MAEPAAKSKRRSDGVGDPVDGADAPFALPDDHLHGAGVLAEHVPGTGKSRGVAGFLERLERVDEPSGRRG